MWNAKQEKALKVTLDFSNHLAISDEFCIGCKIQTRNIVIVV